MGIGRRGAASQSDRESVLTLAELTFSQRLIKPDTSPAFNILSRAVFNNQNSRFYGGVDSIIAFRYHAIPRGTMIDVGFIAIGNNLRESLIPVAHGLRDEKNPVLPVSDITRIELSEWMHATAGHLLIGAQVSAKPGAKESKGFGYAIVDEFIDAVDVIRNDVDRAAIGLSPDGSLTVD